MLKPLNKSLRRFLLERDLFFVFHLNLIWGATSFRDYVYTRSILHNARQANIMMSFDWHHAFLGWEAWNSIDHKWRIYYKFLFSDDV